MLTTQVTAASRTDSHSAGTNPGEVNTVPKAFRPANRSAAYSGSRKYTPAMTRITHRHTGACPAPPRPGRGRSRGRGALCGYRSHFDALRWNST